MYLAGFPFIGTLIAESERFEKENKIAFLGFTKKDGLYGIENKLDFIYIRIEFLKDGFICCYTADLKKEIFDKKFNLVLTPKGKFDYIGHNMFIVYEESKNTKYGFLYRNNEPISEFKYRKNGMTACFSNSNFALLSKNMSDYGIINSKGEEIYEITDATFKHPTLTNNTLQIEGEYINLLDFSPLPFKDYHNEIRTNNKEYVSYETKTGQICLLNTITCEYTLFGKATIDKSLFKEEKRKIVPKEKIIPKATPPNKPKQNRNDVCNCGSGKKYKNCCINKK
jgi:hypothetical protein